MTYYHNKINNCSDSRALFKTFSSLLCPPPPPPSSILTADDFATFFTNKTKTISDQFLTPQTNNNFITTNTQSLTSFSPLSETEVSKLILSNHPTTCPLDPIPTHLLQAIDWQEQLPNPLYSSCWICLLPLTQLTTRSSCPSSERWASQEPPSCGSGLTSQIGPSGCLGGVRFQSHNFLLLEFLKAQCLDHFLLHLHVVIRIGYSEAWLFLLC